MKIVYIAESEIPSRAANSVHVMKMCQAFADSGLDITLIVPKNNRFHKFDNSIDVFKYYGVNHNFDILSLNCPNIRVLGVLYYGVISAIKAKKLNATLVYGRSMLGCFFSALLKISICFEVHHPQKEKVKDYLMQLLFANKKLKLVVVISSSFKKYLINNFKIDSSKIVVAPDAAEPIGDSVSIENRTEECSSKMQVGYIGHLYPGRGIDMIIKMARRISWMDFHLVGGLEEDIIKWKREAVNLDNVIFHGYVSHAEVGSYLIRFDVLLAPYQKTVFVYGKKQINTADWMSPLKIFEYMSAGKPILCSDLPVLREVLEDGVTAILITPDNLEKWIDALKKIENDKDYAEIIGRKAKQAFLSNYTWGARANFLIKKYCDVSGNG